MSHSGMKKFLGACAIVGLAFGAGGAMAETEMPFALDWKFEGPAAPYFLSIENGHFAAEGLLVTIAEGAGSLDAIPKVATGAFPVGFADMASLMKFIDQNPGAPVTAVMMVYDKPSFSIVGRKSLGIHKPSDLEGKILGAPPPDGAWAQFPIFAAENNIDVSKVTVEPLGFPTREPMLAEGKVDAVAGFSFTSSLNTIRLGVPEEDITVLLMANHGLALYGNAVIVNTDFAKENPEAVKGFVRAIAAGWKDAIADPAAAAKILAAHNPAVDTEFETRRLKMSIDDNVLTDYVKENGMGGVDNARMDKSIEQMKVVYEFINAPDAKLYFDPSFLPQEPLRID